MTSKVSKYIAEEIVRSILHHITENTIEKVLQKHAEPHTRIIPVTTRDLAAACKSNITFQDIQSIQNWNIQELRIFAAASMLCNESQVSAPDRDPGLSPGVLSMIQNCAQKISLERAFYHNIGAHLREGDVLIGGEHSAFPGEVARVTRVMGTDHIIVRILRDPPETYKLRPNDEVIWNVLGHKDLNFHEMTYESFKTAQVSDPKMPDTKPYKCPDEGCSATFTTKKGLYDHRLNKQRVKCDLCGKTISKGKKARHMKTVHKKN